MEKEIKLTLGLTALQPNYTKYHTFGHFALEVPVIGRLPLDGFTVGGFGHTTSVPSSQNCLISVKMKALRLSESPCRSI